MNPADAQDRVLVGLGLPAFELLRLDPIAETIAGNPRPPAVLAAHKAVANAYFEIASLLDGAALPEHQHWAGRDVGDGRAACSGRLAARSAKCQSSCWRHQLCRGTSGNHTWQRRHPGNGNRCRRNKPGGICNSSGDRPRLRRSANANRIRRSGRRCQRVVGFALLRFTGGSRQPDDWQRFDGADCGGAG